MKIQIANVNEVDRENQVDFYEGTKGWETLIESKDSKELLDEFLDMLNDEVVDVVNNWFRIIK